MPRLKRSFHPLSFKQKNRFKSVFLGVMLMLSFGCESQQIINLPAYTHKHLHFGFIIAVNTASFYVVPTPNLAEKFKDTLKTIRSVPQAGFDLGIVTEIGITRYLKVRFVPSLGFTDRELEYGFQGVDTFTVTKQIQSVFLNFPIDLKLISKRLHNFEAYVIAGGKYAKDLISQKDVNQQLAGVKATVRLLPNDLYYEAGGGIEFYLQYFKFGIELKVSQGTRNLIVPDNTIYTQSIQGLYSKTYLLSLTFEG
jgi:hypothetical protein